MIIIKVKNKILNYVEVKKNIIVSIDAILSNEVFNGVIGEEELLKEEDLVSISLIDNLRNFNRYTLVYIRRNIKKKRILLAIKKIKVFEKIVTLSKIYKSAEIGEREIFDMFGVFFENNIKLRRILSDYGFKGFPMKKNFPLSGYLMTKYKVSSKCLRYLSVELLQEFRYFEFNQPWINYIKNK